MKIALKDVDTSMLSENIETVIQSVLGKLGVENEIEGFSISADVLVKFNLIGSEEPMYIYTDRVILGQPEIFTVVPEFDEDGRLVSMQDNENETFEALAERLSHELPSVAIESEFDDQELELSSEEVTTDLTEAVYLHKDGRKVIRYYRDGVGLVAELVATPKEGEDQC